MTLSLRLTALAVLIASLPATAAAQPVTQRGFVDSRATFFPQRSPMDAERAIVDLVAREEVTAKLAAWLQFAAGLDARANTHDQVDARWRIDVADRGARRPALSLRRASATLTRGAVTIDVGKQFIRWGKADIVVPTDHFAPRDFLNVVDSEFLAVTGVRGTWQHNSETIEAAWVPLFTPSRMPLLNQRWTVVPEDNPLLSLVDGGAELPDGQQAGVRWGHTGAGYELSASYFDGFNHLPNIEVTPKSGLPEVVVSRRYPRIRSVGVDAAVPTAWFTIKGEAASFTSSSAGTDEYVLYVIQLERQTGEWQFVGGYAGEVVTNRRAAATFAPDRGLTRSIVGRVSYTIDTNRSAAVETTVRQNGKGVYAKGEYSQARGRHWRATVGGAVIGGDDDDFLGQYRRNSHLTVTIRYSF